MGPAVVMWQESKHSGKSLAPVHISHENAQYKHSFSEGLEGRNFAVCNLSRKDSLVESCGLTTKTSYDMIMT